jgi:hypothetical protein
MAQNYNIHYFSSFASLPSPYLELIQHEVSRHGLFREPAWFNHLMKHVFDEDDNELRLYGVEDAESGAPLLFAPLLNFEWVTGSRTDLSLRTYVRAKQTV